MYCPKCNKEVSGSGQKPDNQKIKDYLSASLDVDGNQIYDIKSLERSYKSSGNHCFWCGTELLKKAPGVEPKLPNDHDCFDVVITGKPEGVSSWGAVIDDIIDATDGNKFKTFKALKEEGKYTVIQYATRKEALDMWHKLDEVGVIVEIRATQKPAPKPAPAPAPKPAPMPAPAPKPAPTPAPKPAPVKPAPKPEPKKEEWAKPKATKRFLIVLGGLLLFSALCITLGVLLSDKKDSSHRSDDIETAYDTADNAGAGEYGDWSDIDDKYELLGSPDDYIESHSDESPSDIRSAAYDEYSSIKDMAYDLYTTVKDEAYDEYNSIKDEAYERYQDKEIEYSEYNNIQSEAYQKYNKIQSSAYSRYNKMQSKAYEWYNKVSSKTYHMK